MADSTNTTTSRAEAERLLGIAEKLLQNRDLTSSRDFAILAQETEPLLEGSDQILAVADVLLASERRINNHHDWYAILQIDRRSDDFDSIKKQYRRLALLLHPDKNKFALSDHAFKLVADAWSVLSNSGKKSLFDNELSLYTKVDLVPMKKQNQQQQQQQQYTQQQEKLPVRRGEKEKNKQEKLSSFWTACPYCYILYEYPRVYDGCCLRCENCQRAFHAAAIPSLPPLVPGKEAYYCCWGFFPLGFAASNADGSGGKTAAAAAAAAGFPNWMPPMFSPPQNEKAAEAGPPAAAAAAAAAPVNVNVDLTSDGIASAELGSQTKKRGRPRKYPVPV